MALILADRVKETCSAPGTGTVTLLGAEQGYQSFAVVGNGNTTYYVIADQSGNNWEVGIGTYTSSGTTLSRDTVLASSNGGSATNFSSGVQDVFVSYPAERGVWVNGSNVVFSNSATVANNQLANSTISGVSLGSNLGTLTLGSYLTGTSYNGSTGVTAAVDATDANTASKVVARDASGNFSAGTITAALSGNASTATSLSAGGSYTVVYQSSSGTTAYLTNGTTGQVLTANTGAAPTWENSTAASKAYAYCMSLINGL